MKPVKFKMLSDTTTIPQRSSAGAAGYDIYADQSGVICGYGGRGVVSTGWSMEIPEGYYAEIRPRSGLAAKHGIDTLAEEGLDTLAGVIDSDYRGEVKVLLINHGSKPFKFKAGDRIAQLVFRKHETPEIEVVNELGASVRGDGGFGSTGK